MTYKQNGRYLVTKNGVQFACTYMGAVFISDIDGRFYPRDNLDTVTELTGIHAARKGDIVFDSYGERKILAIDTTHTVFWCSYSSDHKMYSDGYTFVLTEEDGWKLKGQEEVQEMTVEEDSKLVGKKVKIVE